MERYTDLSTLPYMRHLDFGSRVTIMKGVTNADGMESFLTFFSLVCCCK